MVVARGVLTARNGPDARWKRYDTIEWARKSVARWDTASESQALIICLFAPCVNAEHFFTTSSLVACTGNFKLNVTQNNTL